jgi:hypothetical protein
MYLTFLFSVSNGNMVKSDLFHQGTIFQNKYEVKSEYMDKIDTSWTNFKDDLE